RNRTRSCAEQSWSRPCSPNARSARSPRARRAPRPRAPARERRVTRVETHELSVARADVDPPFVHDRLRAQWRTGRESTHDLTASREHQHFARERRDHEVLSRRRGGSSERTSALRQISWERHYPTLATGAPIV